MKSQPFSIDLHTHIRGTMGPKLVRHLAEKNNIQVPTGAIRALETSTYSNFDTFLEFYDQIARVIQHPTDLRQVTMEYLTQCANSGTKYVELMISPDHSEQNGISLDDQFSALADGIEEANLATGVEASVIVTAVRHRGYEAAITLAERISDLQHPIVRGFGLTGNERAFDAKEFAGAFQVARSAGLGCTAHTGEWRDAQSVLHTINELGLTRVGHGIAVVEDDAVLSECAEREIVFEICLTSNAILGSWKDVKTHPVLRMMKAGCKVTLASDDPAYFSTTTAQEYALAKRELSFSSEQITQINLTAINASFARQETKDRLLAQL